MGCRLGRAEPGSRRTRKPATMRTSAGLLITTVVLCGVSHTLAFTSPFLWNARRCLASPQRSVDMKNPNGFALRSRPNCPVACQNSDTNEGKKEDGGTGDVFVLSFDGVLCDSVRETSRIAFEVACEQVSLRPFTLAFFAVPTFVALLIGDAILAVGGGSGQRRWGRATRSSRARQE